VAKTEVFVDTSGWLNAFVRSEPHYTVAAEYLRTWRRERTRVVTTSYIITELVALYVNRIRSPRAEQVKTIETIRTADWVEVVVVDSTLDQEGWNLFKARPD
jgi:predicted nucleic acid-binding protein